MLTAIAGLVLGIVALSNAMSAGSPGTEPATVAANGPPASMAREVYVVQPGDTLWSVAEGLAPGEDPRPVVRELRERHGRVELDVGDHLAIDGLVD